jgi:hypothetical protein
VADAVDFLYAVKVFYYIALDIWRERGPFFMANKLGYSDFLQEIKETIPYSWNESYVEVVKHIYAMVSKYEMCVSNECSDVINVIYTTANILSLHDGG